MTYREMIRELRDSYEEETGERPSAAVAEVLLDRRFDAFAAVFGFEPELAVARDPEAARYLVRKWTGEDRVALRAVLSRQDT